MIYMVGALWLWTFWTLDIYILGLKQYNMARFDMVHYIIWLAAI
jgi:hypothetical protein